MAAPVWMDSVNSVFSRKGVPASIWESIGLAESGLNPSSINTNDPGGSYGLFQLNRGPFGQGRNYDPSTLLDPAMNATIAAPAIARAYQEGVYLGFRGSRLAIYTATHSGHPLTAPKGQLLPPVWWPGYKDAKAEADNVASDYQKVTSPGGLASALGAVGFGVTINGAPPGGVDAGGSIYQQFGTSVGSNGLVKFTPTGMARSGKDPWAAMVMGLHKIQHPGVLDVAIDPGSVIRDVAATWGLVLVALLIILFGGLAMLGIGAGDVVGAVSRL